MEILQVRPPTRPRDVAMFDVQIGPHLRLYNLILRAAGDGFRVIAPSAFGKHSATFTPELAAQITKAAVAAMGGRKANEIESEAR